MFKSDCLISDDSDPLGIRFTFPCSQLLNSGLSFVIISGSTSFEPCFLAFMYSLSACMASSPMKVLAKSLVF